MRQVGQVQVLEERPFGQGKGTRRETSLTGKGTRRETSLASIRRGMKPVGQLQVLEERPFGHAKGLEQTRDKYFQVLLSRFIVTPFFPRVCH